MNRGWVIQFVVAYLVILVGAGGMLAMGASLDILVISLVAGLFALFVMLDRAPPPTARIIDREEEPVDLLDAADLNPLLDGIADPVMIADNGRLVRANRAALRLLGAHILGEDARLAIRHPAAAERLSNPAATDGASIHLVGLGTREQRWEMRTTPLSRARQLIHLVDQSGSHAAEKMRVDFVANASHELRTPLAAILGFIETLADPAAGSDNQLRARFLKIMDDEARRMQRLVDDLMSLSRIEAEKYRLPNRQVDLAALIHEVERIFHDRHAPRGLDVASIVAPDTPPVTGDQAQLSQLVHNLVSNAIKYGRPETPITVRLEPGTGGMVRLSVTDEGEGIAPDHLPRLTERFYRIDSGRSRAMGGTGLGLAIVKHIVERHRGRLDIASTLGKGTVITVHLPAFSDAGAIAAPNNDAPKALSSN